MLLKILDMNVWEDESFLDTCGMSIANLYKIWVDVKNQNGHVQKKYLYPEKIPKHLTRLTLVEPLNFGEQFLYKLVGEDEIAVRTKNPTGQLVSESFYGENGTDTEGFYKKVYKSKSPLYTKSRLLINGYKEVQDETLFLPISQNGLFVDLIYVYSYQHELSGQPA